MTTSNVASGVGSSLLGNKAFWLAVLANTVWINASEIFRYFVFVMPMMRDAFSGIDNIAPMNIAVFLSWGVWDTILVLVVTLSVWVVIDRFGSGIRAVLGAATGLWLGIFAILWLGLFNMNLATVGIVLVALPLAWIEMVVAALIVRQFWNRA
ncbi:MAG: hypothetical protein AAGD43_25410 [Pseudomonadota bacterium]